MPHLTPPPPGFERLPLPITVVPAGEIWYRGWDTAYSPLFFSRNPDNRFTIAPAGVLYVSEAPEGAYIESVKLPATPVGRPVGPVISWTQTHGIAEVEILRDLRAADLTGHNLAKLGIDNRISTCDHVEAQAWAAAIHAHPAGVDAILYHSRKDPSCVALAIFERAAAAVRGYAAGPLSKDPVLLLRVLRRYGHGLAADDPTSDDG